MTDASIYMEAEDYVENFYEKINSGVGSNFEKHVSVYIEPSNTFIDKKFIISVNGNKVDDVTPCTAS